MSTQVILPKFGFSMAHGKLVEWLVADGAAVKEGQPLYVLETDKTVLDIEAPASGVLKNIAKIGEVYQVGFVLAEIS